METIGYKKVRASWIEPFKNELSKEPYNISQIQLYSPLFDFFFTLNATNYNNISFNQKYHVHSFEDVIHMETGVIEKRNVFVKYAPLLDPVKYMVGKYNIHDKNLKILPSIHTAESSFPKYTSRYNASYVDCIFCYLSSLLLNNHGMLNALDYFGTFMGIQERFKINVEDDLEYLIGSSFFKENIGKIMSIENYTEYDNFTNFGSRKNKQKICISQEIKEDVISLEDFIVVIAEDEDEVEVEVEVESKDVNEINEIDGMNIIQEINSDNIEKIYTKEYSSSGNNSEEEISSDDNEDNNEDEDEDDDDNWTDDDESHDKEEAIAQIYNFPVQMIFMEKCDGTIDQMFENQEVNEENGLAMMFQIIMTLLLYQEHYQFTHNDLHTNNIMYIKTDQSFLIYNHKNITYRVPTFGRIYKIIDFGRSIFTFQGKIHCSDSFAPNGDAHTQYNCQPFLDITKKIIEPNKGFDLCRLACSIYDFIEDMEHTNTFKQLITQWCTDDNGRNILYLKNGDERYPGFKLYKMIARLTHEHTPENQLKNSAFSSYICK
jgi:hypothetical protein